MKVSLAGIDAPQISRTKKNPDQPYSRRAKTYLTELVLNELVEIKGYGLDQNDHVLGVIFLEGKNINIERGREHSISIGEVTKTLYVGREHNTIKVKIEGADLLIE